MGVNGCSIGCMLRSDIQITPEILGLVSRIDEFKGAWRALGMLAPERLSALRRVATIESIGSSTRIEGCKLTDREVERLLSNLAIQSFDTRRSQSQYVEVTFPRSDQTQPSGAARQRTRCVVRVEVTWIVLDCRIG